MPSRTPLMAAAALLLLLQLGYSAASGYGSDGYSSAYGGYGAYGTTPAVSRPAGVARRLLQEKAELTHDRKPQLITNERAWPFTNAARPWYSDLSMMSPASNYLGADNRPAKNAWNGMWAALESAMDRASKALDESMADAGGRYAPPAVVDVRVGAPGTAVSVSFGGASYGGYGGYGGYGYAAAARSADGLLGRMLLATAAASDGLEGGDEQVGVITPRRLREEVVAPAVAGSYGGYGGYGSYGAAAGPVRRQLAELVAAPGSYGGYGGYGGY